MTERTKPGPKPSTRKHVRFLMRFTAETHALLVATAQHLDCSMTEIVESAVNEYLKRLEPTKPIHDHSAHKTAAFEDLLRKR